MKRIIMVLGMLLWGLFCVWPGHNAEAAKGKLLFIPQDNRPISGEETADVVRSLGYEVVMPPEEYLNRGTNQPGDPDKLWQWTHANIRGAKAAMVSSDALLYGGLINSRKHEIPAEKLAERVQEFERIHRENPGLKLYVFSSLMRTPIDGAHAGDEEPAYYQQYGGDIFQATSLQDKAEVQGLSSDEMAAMERHKVAVPKAVWQDWKARRQKNLVLTKKLLDLTRQGTFSYLVIGKDDNAPLSQTHRESRQLEAYAKDIPETKFQMLAGIDEFGMLLLSRAVNDLEHQIPFIYVKYNKGTGAGTVPSYSDNPIGDTIRASVLVAGGMMVTQPEKADFVLLVNTNKNGRTGEANDVAPGVPLRNNGAPRNTTKGFVNLVTNYVDKGYAVGIADIAFANGADNALMNQLRDKDLLYKIRAYSGWNTPTNSTGFVIGTGLLANRMENDACDRLLTRRYLEDWGYQANVRTAVADSVALFRRNDVYENLGDHEQGVSHRITSLMRQFVYRNLPPYPGLDKLQVSLPWHRMFEADFHY
ncbi:Protein of unknown function [Selenomonas sp. WCT3]|uniref:DUF4127 family protein n=1 Tax=Selenomonas sp. WCT3 TaxID=3158785 RepID=UPI00087FA733|nr:Protein of unknown function [Selenomonas ruminantium]